MELRQKDESMPVVGFRPLQPAEPPKTRQELTERRLIEAAAYEEPDVPDLTKPPPKVVVAATEALGEASVAAVQTATMQKVLVLVDEGLVKRRDVQGLYQTMVANELVAAATALRDA